MVAGYKPRIGLFRLQKDMVRCGKGFALAISENYLSTGRHKTFYLASGPEDGPLLVMTHGWPELSLSWRHQLKYFGAKVLEPLLQI